MMPTFPPPPLKFRTVSFPQYGFKAGLSDGAFPQRAPVKPAPGIPFARLGLRPPFVLPLPQSCPRSASGYWGSLKHRHASGPPLYPRGPRSGPGCSVPVHLHLRDPIRPTRRHIATSPQGGLYAMPSLCGSASATREWIRAFAVRSFSTCRPLRPRGARRLHTQFHRRRRWPSPSYQGLGAPEHPQDSLRVGLDVSRLARFASATTCRFVSLPGESDPALWPSRRKRLLPGFRRVGHPSRRWI